MKIKVKLVADPTGVIGTVQPWGEVTMDRLFKDFVQDGEVLGVANQEDHDILVGYCFMYGADPSKIVVCEFNYWRICELPVKPDYIVKFEDL